MILICYGKQKFQISLEYLLCVVRVFSHKTGCKYLHVLCMNEKSMVTQSAAGGSVKSDMPDNWRAFKSYFISLKMPCLLVSINFYSAAITNILTCFI